MLLGTSNMQTPQGRFRMESTKAVVNVEPWGWLAGASSSALQGEWLEGRGLYSLGKGYRLYSAGLRRFFQQDHMSPFDAGGINSYVFCLGDPNNLHDPSGQAPVPYLIFKQTIRRGQRAERKLRVAHLKQLLLKNYAVPYLNVRVNFPGLSRSQLKQRLLSSAREGSSHAEILSSTMPRSRHSVASSDSESYYDWLANQMDGLMGSMKFPTLPNEALQKAVGRVDMDAKAIATFSADGMLPETKAVVLHHYGPAILQEIRRMPLEVQRFLGATAHQG